MIRCVLVEDDRACVDQLRDFIDRFSRERGEAVQVTEFYDGEMLLDGYRPDYDVIFMDIEMPNMDGMEAARRVREMDTEVIIVFITNMARYAIHGYEVEALDFILKPVSYFTFSVKMNKVCDLLSRRAGRFVLLNTGDGARKVMTDDILYVEVSNHRLHVHTEEGEYLMPGTLKAFEALVDSRAFVRCNSGYLVNLKNVTGFRQNTVFLAGGGELPISRPRKKAFVQALSDYAAGGA